MALKIRWAKDQNCRWHWRGFYRMPAANQCYFFSKRCCMSRAVEHSLAILIRRRAWSDTSWMVTWLTPVQGKLTTMARGARRPTSPFAGKLDLFFRGEISYAPSNKSSLHSLREVAIHQPFDASNLPSANLFLCSYFSELADLITEPGAPVPELFDLLTRALTHLQSAPANLRALEFFEQEAARTLGIHASGTPALSALESHCGRVPASRTSLLRMLKTEKILSSAKGKVG